MEITGERLVLIVILQTMEWVDMQYIQAVPQMVGVWDLFFPKNQIVHLV